MRFTSGNSSPVDPSSSETISTCLENDRWNSLSWYVLYTKGRHEKLVDRELQKKRIETFLPLRKITRRWSDRRKIITEPLFKSYLFVHFPWKDRWNVLNTTGVVRFVGSSFSDPACIPEQELFAIQRFVENDIQIDPFPYLKQGERVYIRSGPFKGVEGFIIRKDKHSRLVISLNLLMQSISIEIDAACVEPV